MLNQMTAIGYVRVSTEEQAREGYSLDNQRKDISDYCQYKGWDLVDIYADEGISGAGMDERIGLLRALKLLHTRKINYLVVWKLSRLSRKVADVVRITERLDHNETFLISVKDNIDTSSPMGKPFLYIASIFAEMERDSMIIQVKGGMEQKAREGRWNGGISPIGYRLQEKELVIDEVEAEIVKTIFTEYLKDNGYKAIAKLLNDQGYKTRKGFAFSGGTVKEILRNPTYMGKIRWGKLKNWSKKNSDGERTRTYNDEAILVDGIHQAIVDEDTFNRVQNMIDTNPRNHVKQFSSNHILSGLLKCPDCGYGMSIQQMNRSGRFYAYYSCNQYANKKTCKPNLIPKEKIEAEFFEILDTIINEEEFMNRILFSLNNAGLDIIDIEKSIERKQAELRKLKTREEKLFDELLEGDEQYRDKIRMKILENSNALNLIDEEIKKLNVEIYDLRESKIDIGEVAELLKNAGKMIKLMDADTQKRLIRKLISQIETEDKCIKTLYFSFDESFRIGTDTVNRIINNGYVLWESSANYSDS